MKLTLGQVAHWIHAEGTFDNCLEVSGYSIDSRTIGSGEMFFAVRGEKLDGHDFVCSALASGAAAAVVSKSWAVPEGVDRERLLRVPDEDSDGVLLSLQRLANEVRRYWGKRVIGITGSAGKTTTKEAVAQVLSAKFKVLKSHGNLNNAFGLPLQLLRLEPEHEIAVLEMGMNHAGEITALARIAEPNWAIVSNVAPVHLEHFADGIRGIAKAKYELVESLPLDGIAILNCDDEYVASFGDGLEDRRTFYGFGNCADVRATQFKELGADGIAFTVNAAGECLPIRLNILGRHNVYNALAAVAAGLRCGMALAECAGALSDLAPAEKRGEIVKWREVLLINDCYNSNPRALDAMVDALLAMPAADMGRHIVVAGEMLELGPEGERLHRECGERMVDRGIDLVLGVRGLARALVSAVLARGGSALYFETPEEAGQWLRDNLRNGDCALLKASRGVRLERAFTTLGE